MCCAQTGLSGIHHIADKDFSAVIKRAQELPGFSEEDIAAFPHKEVNVGYAHNTVLGASGEVVKVGAGASLGHHSEGYSVPRKWWQQQQIAWPCAAIRGGGQGGQPPVLCAERSSGSHKRVNVCYAHKTALGTSGEMVEVGTSTLPGRWR